ncbi:hypothetical protein Trydic_g16670 [Trypoxylus dichotomus]
MSQLFKCHATVSLNNFRCKFVQRLQKLLVKKRGFPTSSSTEGLKCRKPLEPIAPFAKKMLARKWSSLFKEYHFDMDDASRRRRPSALDEDCLNAIMIRANQLGN